MGHLGEYSKTRLDRGPLGGPSLRDGLRRFDKARAHRLCDGFNARLDAKLLVDMAKMHLD